MPLYEYQCERCGLKEEVILRSGDPPLTVCGSCGGPMKKLLSAPAVQFKGSGWYVNDYAKPASATDKTDKGSSEKPAASASEKSGTEGKSEKAAVDKPADKPAERKAESSRGEAAPAPSAPKAE